MSETSKKVYFVATDLLSGTATKLNNSYAVGVYMLGRSSSHNIIVKVTQESDYKISSKIVTFSKLDFASMQDACDAA